MKRIITHLVCLILGIGVGWYFGYTRPTTKKQRELLAQYQYVRDNNVFKDSDLALRATP